MRLSRTPNNPTYPSLVRTRSQVNPDDVRTFVSGIPSHCSITRGYQRTPDDSVRLDANGTSVAVKWPIKAGAEERLKQRTNTPSPKYKRWLHHLSCVAESSHCLRSSA